MTFAICFDFPETTTGPFFAAIVEGAAGWTNNLETAERFDSEDIADRFLANGYGETAAFGTVVEIASES